MQSSARLRAWVLPAILTLFVLVPELRRLIDWPLGFSALPVINLIPLVALAALFAVVVRKHEPKAPRPVIFTVVRTIWLVGFGFAFLVSMLGGGKLAPIYQAGLFILPILVAAYISRGDAPVAEFESIGRALMWLGGIVGLYGFYQFVAPPPWDVAWVHASGLSSIGTAAPYQLRVFSTLNSPGICGDFLALAILTQMPALKAGRDVFTRIVCIALMLGCLALTFDRSAWIGLVIGLAVYLSLSPARATAIPVVGGIGLAIVLLLTNGESLFGPSPIFTLVNSRLATLDQVQSDDSYLARQAESNAALHESLTEPLGQGLGNVGTATKLANSGSTTSVDNGYLSRFLEMGVFGFGAYLLALAVAGVSGLQGWLAAKSTPATQTIAAACVAIQVALGALDISSDHHNGLNGVFFWIAVSVPALMIARRTEHAPNFVDASAAAT